MVLTPRSSSPRAHNPCVRADADDEGGAARSSGDPRNERPGELLGAVPVRGVVIRQQLLDRLPWAVVKDRLASTAGARAAESRREAVDRGGQLAARMHRVAREDALDAL